MKRILSDRLRAVAVSTWMTALAVMVMLGLTVQSRAQVEEAKDIYGVVPFASEKSSSDLDVGSAARNQVQLELSKLTKLGTRGVELLPNDTVAARVSDLGLVMPLSRTADASRLGNELGANFLVSGTVTNFEITDVQGGKTARAIMQVLIWNVASAMKVNGAAVQGSSGVRPSDTPNATLIEAALKDAAYTAVREISSRVLPSATILNTNENKAYVNQGTRSGFAKGQKVIIVRANKEQVAEGEVTAVEPDASYVTVTRTVKGVQPGDKISVVFEPPVPTAIFGTNGSPRVKKSSSNSGGLGGLFQVILVVGLVALLFGQGRGSSEAGVASAQAEAYVLPDDTPAVQVSWSADGFLRGNFDSTPRVWQVWRRGESLSPVISVDGSLRSAREDATLSDNIVPWTARTNANSSPASLQCPAQGGAALAPGTRIVAGTPAEYGVEVVYMIKGTALPNPVTGDCFYVSERVATGLATPLNRPALQKPDDNLTVANATSFSFSSVRGAASTIPLKYVLQMSDTPTFTGGTVVTFDDPRYYVIDTATKQGVTLATPSVPFQASFPAVASGAQLYWRIGVRNLQDSPGPKPDEATGQRYIFSSTRIIKKA